MNVTWSVRYANTHPVAALRGKCLSGASDCPVVVPDGEDFVFDYVPDTPYIEQPGRVGSGFEAYDEPITVTAATQTGFSELTTTLEVPALPALGLSATNTIPCFDFEDTIRRIDAPDAWFALELEASNDVEIYLDVFDPAADQFRIWPTKGYAANEVTLSLPTRGRGAPSVVDVHCLNGATEVTLLAQSVAPAGTLTVGQVTEIPTSPRGDFYVFDVPANPPRSSAFGSEVTVAVREDASFGGDVELVSSRGNVGDRPTCELCDFNAATIDPFGDTEFAVLVHEDPFFDTTEILVELPAPNVSIDRGETVATALNLGFVPTVIELTAPENQWVLLTNDAGVVMEVDSGGWNVASLLFEDEWRAAFVDGGAEAFRLALPPSRQFFLPDGLGMTVRSSAPQALTLGSATNGTLAPSGHDYVQLFVFDSGGQDVVLTTNSTAVTYYVLAPGGQMLRQCGGTSCSTSGAIGIDTSGPHALAVRIATGVAVPENYGFTLSLAP
jgi:hypothetical protein